MLNLSLNEIIDFIHIEKLHNKNFILENIYINYISTNSNDILKNTLFIALVGKKFNGHDFIEEAINNGAIGIICNKEYVPSEKIIYKVPFIIVDDTYKSIADLARRYREKYLNNVKFIAITGSVGKTTTKEIISNILNTEYQVCKTEKNFNNLLGVSKTIFNINKKYEIAILEFGMSHKNEIDCLTKIVKPNIVIITNIGVAHIENFNSKINILKAKLESTKYMKKNDILILNGDDELLKTIKTKNDVIKYQYSLKNNNMHLYTNNILLKKHYSKFDIFCEKKLYIKNCKLNIAGIHNIYNVLSGILVGKILNVKSYNIKKAILKFENIELRQKVYNYNSNIFIEDCYNASPESMKASFDVLDKYSKFKIFILGSMNELGSFSKKFHNAIGILAEKKSDLIIFMGNNDNIKYYTYGIKNKEKYIICSNCDEVVKYLHTIDVKNSVILIKGSRNNQMEKIISKYNINS